MEDISRPTILRPLLKKLIAELRDANLHKEHNKFLICNGAHPPMLRKDIELKLGKNILQDFHVINHTPYDNLMETDVIQGNTRLRINKYYFEADLKVAVGSIIPHSMAGFSSGAKLVLPGVSDIATLERTHKFAIMGFAGGVNDVEKNKFRQNLEDAVSHIGIDFFVGVVPNSEQEIAGIFTGDMVAAHRAGVDFAREIFKTKITSHCDILILNAFPKDIDLFQAESAFTSLRTSHCELVRKEGIVVIISRCPNGLGYHSLFGPGMRLHRKPIQRSLLNGRDLIFFSPNIQQAEFYTMFWSGYKIVNNSADTAPEKEAVVSENLRFSYREVEEKANKIANWLIESGICKGDRIGLLLQNSVEYIVSYYGILKAGAIAVPINTGSDIRELAAIINDCCPRLLITQTQFLKKFPDIKKIVPGSLLAIADMGKDRLAIVLNSTEYLTFSNIYVNASVSRPNRNIIDCDVSSIIYTSGSTGRPKGVMLTHGNIVANTKSIASYLKLSSADRCMVVLPFYYVYGKSLLNTHFMVSGTVIISNQMVFPHMVIKKKQEEKVTGFAGVSSTFAILLDKTSMTSYNLPYLRYLTQAGGYMPSRTKKDLMNLFDDKQIFIMYGATEASARLSYLDPKKLSNKLDSIGKPIPNVQLNIFSEKEKEQGSNEEGEIVARGSNIMKGYWNDPDETAKVIKNGWYHTGDLGFRDKEGFYYITGRKRDMIKAGSHKVSAIEVEDLIYQHADIYEAAVVGVLNQDLTEEICAFIVLKENSNVDEQDILKFCEQRLSNYKIPNKILSVDALPKNEAGKIQKRKLVRKVSAKYDN